MKINFHYAYPININIACDQRVDVYIDCLDLRPTGGIKIVYLEEPFLGEMYYKAIEHQDKYNFLMTFHEELLSMPKARKFHCLNTWVKGYKPTKHFAVSTVVGGKYHPSVPGYGLRHDLWRNRERITVPREFYLSGNAKHSHNFVPWSEADYTGQLVLGASKTPLFDSMFHVCIENLSYNNYFTEKILDCFQTHTVPIYWGCPNIEEYFNSDGILHAETLDDIIAFCNSATPEMYAAMKEAMDENFTLSEQYCDHDEQIKYGVARILIEQGLKVYE